MSADKLTGQRPYWHVDAKWICGLLLGVSLTITFFLYNLAQITAEEPGVETLTLILASMFTQGEMDEESDISFVMEEFEKSPDGTWQPIPSLNIIIKESDIEGLSPPEMRLYFFRQWAAPLYRDGVAGLANLADDPELRTSIEEGAGLIGVLNAENHQLLKNAQAIPAIISLLLIVCLIFFSYRFGRLGSPGCVMVLSALPPAFLIFISRTTFTNPSRISASVEEGGLTAMISRLAASMLPDLTAVMLRNYLIILGIGLGLMLVAGLGSILFRPKRDINNE